MKIISKIIGNLITIAYAVLAMPLLVIMAILFPIMTISDAFKIIGTGYTVTGDYIPLIMGMLVIMYVSLRFRVIRRIYSIFPSLFETLKYLIIASIFIGVGTEILNWSYITLTSGRKTFGIIIFALVLVIWRVLVSIYYRKKPISQSMLEESKKLQNYNEELS